MVLENIETKLLKCKSSTDSSKLAGSIFSTYQENNDVRIIIRVIGAGALNQATKAVIISNKFFSKKGLSVALKPSFSDCDGDMTAIELRVIIFKD